MGIAEDAAEEHLGVALYLRFAVQPAPGVVEVDVPQPVEPRQLRGPQGVQGARRLVLRPGGEEPRLMGLEEPALRITNPEDRLHGLPPRLFRIGRRLEPAR